jgi:hypothetical protein
MLKDRRARAAWRLFRARAEWMLGSVASGVRTELLSDLEAHVRDAVAEAPGDDEFAKVSGVLAQLGDPREFLAPLVAEAVFKRPRPVSRLLAPVQAVLVAAHGGARQATAAAGRLIVFAIGGALAVMGAMRLALPEGAGVFRLDADTIQVRLLGAGVQMLPAWLAILLALAGLAAAAWALDRSRRQLVAFFTRPWP